ncbi:MAG: outer membrane beta-barrel family protein [Bacteroidota bacterium]
MKIRNTLFSILVLFSLNVVAQNHYMGRITGTVLIESTKKPLEFVNVIVLSKSDSLLVTGAVTDNRGYYEIVNIPVGEYFIKYSLLGYEERQSKNFAVDTQQREMDFGKTYLKESAVLMGEVTVTTQKMILNTSIDRKVYNVQQDILSKTGSASDLLQNIPSVQVDIDGTVSLRGSENVLILLNGKPSPLMGKNRAEVLQQMPASSIEKIEVITNPSAKFKPDGTSGIINIVMKKDAGSGLNGTLSGNAGNHDRYNGNINLNYNPGTYNIFGSYSIRQDERNSFTTDRRMQYDSTGRFTGYHNEDGSSTSRPLSHIVVLGMDYRLDTANSFGFSGNYRYRGFTRTETSAKVTRDVGSVITEDYDRLRYDPEYEKEMGGNAYFQHNFDGEDHKLRAEFTASHQPELEDNHYTNVYRFPAASTQYDNMRIDQNENQNQLTVDYSNKLTETSTIEAGYAGNFNKRDMDYHGEYLDAHQRQFVTDLQKTSHFIYNETIHALYATYESSIGSLGFLGGLRVEQSFIHANLVSRDSIITNDYLKLYPTLHLSYHISPGTELQLNYSRRANRPEGDDLNPFPEYQDPRNVRAGNPRLMPELIHSVEFGFQWQNDNLTIVPSVFYRNRHNGFTRVTTSLNDTTLLTTQANLASDESAGFDLVVSGNAGNTFSANFSANAFYEQIDASNLGFSDRKSTTTWSGSLNCNLNLASATMIQMNSNYRSSRLTPQGEFKPSFVMNLGVRQDLFDEKLSVVLTVSDILKTLKREMNLDTPWLNQNTVNNRDTRIIYFGLTYHFGTQAKKSKEKSLQYDNNL